MNHELLLALARAPGAQRVHFEALLTAANRLHAGGVPTRDALLARAQRLLRAVPQR